MEEIKNKSNFEVAREDWEKIHQKLLNWSCQTTCKIIKRNKDIDYQEIDKYFLEDFNSLKNENSMESILIYETYTLLEIIKNQGINEDNYTNKEQELFNSLKIIKKLTCKDIKLVMLPRPSKVIYILKYYLYNYFKLNKDTVKSILDIIQKKENPTNTRMPKKKDELDNYIKLMKDVKNYKFNNTEGREKYQHLGESIFDIPELQEFRSLVYGEEEDTYLIKEELKKLQ